MNDEDRRLLVESIAEMRELKGELREFKAHVFERFKRLESNEGQRHKDMFSVLALLISSMALAMNIIANFCK